MNEVGSFFKEQFAQLAAQGKVSKETLQTLHQYLSSNISQTVQPLNDLQSLMVNQEKVLDDTIDLYFMKTVIY